VRFSNQTLPETPVTTESRSLATALPVGALRERLHNQDLHHARGHDHETGIRPDIRAVV